MSKVAFKSPTPNTVKVIVRNKTVRRIATPVKTSGAKNVVEPAVRVADPVVVPADLGISRFGVAHKLTIGGKDYAPYLKSVTVNEEISKDIDAQITLDNHEFGLSNDAELGEGKTIVLSLFDGLAWRVFPTMMVANPSRDYASAGVVKMQGRSKQIALQLIDKSNKWEKVTDSQVALDIAAANKLTPLVEETTEERETVVRGEEPVTNFMRKLAVRNQYEFRITATHLIFRRPVAKKSGIVLNYRPNSAMGTIIKASRKKKSDTKNGASSTATVPYMDAKTGAVDAVSASESGTGSSNSNKELPPGRAPYIRPGENSPKAAMADGKTKNFEGGADIYHSGRGALLEYAGQHHASDEVASNSKQAAAMAAGLDETEGFSDTLSVDTYGQVKLRVSDIVDIRGLAKADSGKWLVKKMRSAYQASSAYRINLSFISSDKAVEAGLVGTGAEVKPKRESDWSVTIASIHFNKGGRLQKVRVTRENEKRVRAVLTERGGLSKSEIKLLFKGDD